MNGATFPILRALGLDQVSRHKGALGTVGAAPGPMVWQVLAPSGSDYVFKEGERYAVLASVSLNYPLADIEAKMRSEGFDVTYAWEYGTPGRRPPVAIDDWLAGLAADPRSNHRWVYGEVNRSGPDTTIGVDPPWPLTIYHLAQVLEAVPAPPGTAPSDLPTTVSAGSSSRAAPIVVAGVSVAALVGLAWAAARWL